MAIAQPQAPARNAQAAQQVQIPAYPFPVGVEATKNQSDYDQTVTQTTGVVAFPDVRIQPDGWLRGIWFDFNMVTSANAAAVAFNENGPWNVIDTVLLLDTGGEQIFGPFDGYTWMIINKFGGYHSQNDPRGDVTYSVTTGAVGAGGSFHFNLYLPLELTSADALGSVENRSENSVYRVQLRMAAGSTVYSVAPTTLGAMEVKTTQDSYSEPIAVANPGGRPIADAPPSPGTIQYWKQENAVVPAASSSYTIINGIGNGYRSMIFELIRTASTRANGDVDFPDPFELTLGTMRLAYLGKKQWKAITGRTYELTSATADAAFGLENGVFPLTWAVNRSPRVGGDYHNYLRTKTGNTLKARGTYGNAGTLYVTTNYVVPRNNDFSVIIGR